MYAIELINISKKFGNFSALKNVTLKIKKGEIHALLGENGAGKSTIMSILFGSYKADSGKVIVNDNLKVGMVHQHFQLVNNYTVLENIILGCEDVKYGFLLDKQKSVDKVKKILKKYSFDVDINEKVENISVCTQQKTEILKMLYKDAEVLIFDEPTSVLTPQEIKSFLKMLLDFKKEGKTIIFITHKIDEIIEVADRVSILKKGELVDTFEIDSSKNREELSKKMANMMMGDDKIVMPDKKAVTSSKVVLKVRNLSADSSTKKNIVNNVNFDVKAGEIVGVIGVDGNGQRDLVYVITGLRKSKKGKIIFNGVQLKDRDVKTRNKMGMSHIPGNQHKHGLILNLNVKENLIIRDFETEKFSSHGLLKKDKINENAEDVINRYNVKTPNGINSLTGNMSGGNQQKLIIARELERKPSLLIAVQPTRGIDYGSTKRIHSYLLKQKNNGVAILLVSFELDEILDLSDRILVMFNGSIVGEFNPKDVSREELGLYMSGAKNNNQKLNGEKR